MSYDKPITHRKNSTEEAVALKIKEALAITSSLIITIIISLYLMTQNESSYLVYPIIIILGLFLTVAVVYAIALMTLIPLRKRLPMLIRPPYLIGNIRIRGEKITADIFKNSVYFASLHIENLNPDYLSLIIPITTPLAFFDKSSKRIIGDGEEIITTKFRDETLSLRTEFDWNKNYLTARIISEKLDETCNILEFVDTLKDTIEKMRYSDENIKKIPDEMIAAHHFMRGRICLKCGNLIPDSKQNENCPADNGPHEIKSVLLDTHPPRSIINKIAPPYLMLVISLIIIELRFLSSQWPWSHLFLLGLLEGTAAVFAGGYCFRKTFSFKNMLRHFEAKKEYVLEAGKRNGNGSYEP